MLRLQSWFANRLLATYWAKVLQDKAPYKVQRQLLALGNGWYPVCAQAYGLGQYEKVRADGGPSMLSAATQVMLLSGCDQIVL
eukprot:1745749-Amphidinium_carterae.1